MILVTRLDGSQFYINALHVEAVEATPDTHVVMTNGQRYLVRESPEELARRFTRFCREVGGIPVARAMLRTLPLQD